MGVKRQKYKAGDKLIIQLAENYNREGNHINERPEKIWRVRHFNSLVFDEAGLDKLERLDGNYTKEQVTGIINDAVAYFNDLLIMINSKMIEGYYDTDDAQDAEENAIRTEVLEWIESMIVNAQKMFIRSHSEIYCDDCEEDCYETNH